MPWACACVLWVLEGKGSCRECDLTFPTHACATTCMLALALQEPRESAGQAPDGVPKLANETPVNTPPPQVRLRTAPSGTTPQVPNAVCQATDASPMGVSIDAAADVRFGCTSARRCTHANRSAAMALRGPPLPPKRTRTLSALTVTKAKASTTVRQAAAAAPAGGAMTRLVQPREPGARDRPARVENSHEPPPPNMMWL